MRQPPWLAQIAQSASECSARAAARCAAARLGTDVVGVDEWPRVIAGRLRAAPLLGPPRFRWRRETRNLDPELAPIACGQFFGLRIEWLTGNRAHGTEATPGHRLTNARLSVCRCSRKAKALEWRRLLSGPGESGTPGDVGEGVFRGRRNGAPRGRAPRGPTLFAGVMMIVVVIVCEPMVMTICCEPGVNGSSNATHPWATGKPSILAGSPERRPRRGRSGGRLCSRAAGRERRDGGDERQRPPRRVRLSGDR